MPLPPPPEGYEDSQETPPPPAGYEETATAPPPPPGYEETGDDDAANAAILQARTKRSEKPQFGPQPAPGAPGRPPLTKGQKWMQRRQAQLAKNPDLPDTSGPGILGLLKNWIAPSAGSPVQTATPPEDALLTTTTGFEQPGPPSPVAPAAPVILRRRLAQPPAGAAGSIERLAQRMAARQLQPQTPTPNVPDAADLADPNAAVAALAAPGTSEGAPLSLQAAQLLGAGILAPDTILRPASTEFGILRHKLEPQQVTSYLNSPQGQGTAVALGVQYGLPPEAARAAIQAAASAASTATDPKMAALGVLSAIPGVGPVLAAAFAVQMGYDLATDKATRLGEAIGSGDRAAAADVLGEAAPEAAFAVLGGLHSAKAAGRVADRAIGMDKSMGEAFRGGGGGEGPEGAGWAAQRESEAAGQAARERLADAGMGPEPTLQDKLELMRLRREVDALKAQVEDTGGPLARGPFEVPKDVKGPIELTPEQRARLKARLTPNTQEGNVPPAETHPLAIEPDVPAEVPVPPEVAARLGRNGQQAPPVETPAPDFELGEPTMTPEEWDARQRDQGPQIPLADRRAEVPPELGGEERRVGPRRGEARPLENDRRVPPAHPEPIPTPPPPPVDPTLLRMKAESDAAMEAHRAKAGLAPPENPPVPTPEELAGRPDWDQRKRDLGAPEGAEQRQPLPPELGGPEKREAQRREEPRPGSDRRAQVAQETGLSPDHPAVDRIVSLEAEKDVNKITGLKGVAHAEKLAREVAESGGKHSALALDVAGLKRTNDTMGHGAGDALLRAVADVLKKELGDDVAHPHGDEFSGLLRDVPLEKAQERADAIRKKLAGVKLTLENPTTGERVDLDGLQAHIGVGKDADAADAAANADTAAPRRGSGPDEGKPLAAGGAPPDTGVPDRGSASTAGGADTGGAPEPSGATDSVSDTETVSGAKALERARAAVPAPEPVTPPAKIHLAEKLSKHRAAVEESTRDALARAGNAPVVVFEDPQAAPGLRRLVVSKDPSSEKWRITRMSEDGEPTGHSTHPSREDAIRSAAGQRVNDEPPIGSVRYKVVDTRGSDVSAPTPAAEGLLGLSVDEPRPATAIVNSARDLAQDDYVSLHGKTYRVERTEGDYHVHLRRVTSGNKLTFDPKDRKVVDVRSTLLTKTEAPQIARNAAGEREFKTSLSQRLASTLPSQVKGIQIPNEILDRIGAVSTAAEAKALRERIANRIAETEDVLDPNDKEGARDVKLLRAMWYLADQRAREHMIHGDGHDPVFSLTAKVRALNEQRAMEREAKEASGGGDTGTPAEELEEAPRPLRDTGAEAAEGGEAEGTPASRGDEGRNEPRRVGENGPRGGTTGESAAGTAAEGRPATEAGAVQGPGGAEAPQAAEGVGEGTRLLDPEERAKAAPRVVEAPVDEESVGAAARRGFGKQAEPTVMDWLRAKLKGRPDPERIHTSVKAHLADLFGHDTLHEAKEIDPSRLFERAAAELGGARTKAHNMLLAAAKTMLGVMKSPEELSRVHAYLLDGAMQDAKARWQDIASTVRGLPDAKLVENAERGDYTTPLAGLDNTRPFQGANLEEGLVERIRAARDAATKAAAAQQKWAANPQDATLQAKATAAYAEATKTAKALREHVVNAAEAAASYIPRINLGNGMTPEDYGKRTDVRDAVRLWKKYVSDPLLAAHLKNEGSYDSRYDGKTAGAFYPLMAEEHEGGGIVDQPRIPFARARNLQNYFRTGVSEGGYKVDPEALQGYVASVIRRSAQSNLHDTGVRQGVIHLLDDARSRPDTMVIGGRAYKTSPVVSLDPWGKKMGYMPEGIYRELKPILMDEGASNHFVAKLADAAMHVATFGFGEGVLHTASMNGRYAVSTPFLGEKLLTKGLNTPMTKGLVAIADMFHVDPKSEAYWDVVARLSRIGAMPERVGTLTADPKLAAAAGIEKKAHWMAAGIYGPEGADARMRVGAANVALKWNPDITDAQLYDYMKQFGIYNHQLQSIAARFFKTTKLGQFYTAGYSGLRAGIDATLGTGTTPFGSEKGTGKASFKVQQQLSAGLAAAVAYWMLMSKFNTGQWPHEDKDSRFLQVKLTPEQRASAPGRMLFGDDLAKNAYVSPFSGFLGVNMPERGARALGVKALTEGLIKGKEPYEIELDALKDFVNSTTHMTAGPLVRAAMAPLNLSPSVRRLYDPRTKQFGLEPQRLGFGKVRSTGDVAKRMASGFAEAINPTSSAIFKGLSAKSPARALADMVPVVKLTGPVAPEDTISPRQKAIADLRAGKTPDLSGIRPKSVNSVFSDATKSADEVRYTHMPFEKLLDAYDAEGDPEKRSVIKRVIAQRSNRGLSNLPPASMEKTSSKLSSVMSR